jgi:hypothetical protein
MRKFVRSADDDYCPILFNKNLPTIGFKSLQKISLLIFSPHSNSSAVRTSLQILKSTSSKKFR